MGEQAHLQTPAQAFCVVSNRNAHGCVKAAIVEGSARRMTCVEIAKQVGASYYTVHSIARRIKADLPKRSYTKAK